MSEKKPFVITAKHVSIVIAIVFAIVYISKNCL